MGDHTGTRHFTSSYPISNSNHLLVNKSDLLPALRPLSTILAGSILHGLCNVTFFEYRAFF